MSFPKKLQKKLDARAEIGALRQLSFKNEAVDFSSNDYLGFSKNQKIFNRTHHLLEKHGLQYNGATGSRLLSGNHLLYSEAEIMLAAYHNVSSALIFNSGYDANVGFFSSVPQRGDIIYYDEFIHASIRDGIQISLAKSYKFKHNDIKDLQAKLNKCSAVIKEDQQVYIVTESIFSMDGDMPDLIAYSKFCKENNYYLIVDEAHGIGVFGKNGCGRIQELNLEKEIFARIITFGKALGCHGAAILGSELLKSYLVNFARSFIYTTGLPPHAIATIKESYQELLTTSAIDKLRINIKYFNLQIYENRLQELFIESTSAIHCCMISENKSVKKTALRLQEKGFDVKAILSPTVPKGKERLRFCLHAYNSKEEILEVLGLLATFV